MVQGSGFAADGAEKLVKYRGAATTLPETADERRPDRERSEGLLRSEMPSLFYLMSKEDEETTARRGPSVSRLFFAEEKKRG